MAQCANCGAKVPDDAAHCVQCGNSMTAAEPAGPTKKTMVGITGVDQSELQRAIAAARAATASGEAPKKQARRTMMGVAAISVQQIQKAAAAKEESLDDDWGAAPGAPAAADKLDEGWGTTDDAPPAVSPAKAPTPSAPPTKPSTPMAKATMDLGSMAGRAPAAPLVPESPRITASFGSIAGPGTAAPPRPATGPRATVAFDAAPLPEAAAPPARAPVAPPRPTTGPKATVALSAMAAPPATPATQSTAPPRPTTGSRGAAEAPAAPVAASRTVAFAAMAPAPTAPATQAPARPITGSRSVEAPQAPLPAGFEDAPTPLPPEPDADLADTLSAGPEVARVLSAVRSDRPAATGERISPSSPDPLADTISPGSMRIDQILREAAAEADASMGHGPAPIPSRADALTPLDPLPMAKSPAAPAPLAAPSGATTSSTGLKKPGTTTKPPFLASKALAEDIHPTEPGRAEMRLAAAVGGGLLAALWAIPTSLSPLVFSWQATGTLTGAAKVFAFYTPAAGVVLLLLGLLPVPYRVRALGALVLGMVPVIAAVGGLGPLEATRGWPGALISVGMILLPGALVHRANYRASVLARVLVALGLLLVLAWMFVPRGSGFLPALLGGFSSSRGIVQSVVMIASLFLVVASLLAFMPSTTTGGCGKTGRLLLFVRPALAAAAAIAGGTAGSAPLALGASLGLSFVFGALASLGTAQTLASIERPATR